MSLTSKAVVGGQNIGHAMKAWAGAGRRGIGSRSRVAPPNCALVAPAATDGRLRLGLRAVNLRLDDPHAATFPDPPSGTCYPGDGPEVRGCLLLQGLPRG